MREDKEEMKMNKVLCACAHTHTHTKFPMDKNIKFSLNQQSKEDFSKSDFQSADFPVQTKMSIAIHTIEGTNDYTFNKKKDNAFNNFLRQETFVKMKYKFNNI